MLTTQFTAESKAQALPPRPAFDASKDRVHRALHCTDLRVRAVSSKYSRRLALLHLRLRSWRIQAPPSVCAHIRVRRIPMLALALASFVALPSGATVDQISYDSAGPGQVVSHATL